MSKIWKFRLFAFGVCVVFVLVFYITHINHQPVRERVYSIHFKNISTLEKGAPVIQNGLEIGAIAKIASKTVQQPTKEKIVVVDVRLNDRARIALDSKASIQTLGMKGDKFIDISLGQMDEAPEGSCIEIQDAQQAVLTLSDRSDALKLAPVGASH